jgi:hypothetical protein
MSLMMMEPIEVTIRVGDIKYQRVGNQIVLYMDDYNIDSILSIMEDDCYGDIETKFEYNISNKRLFLVRLDQRIIGTTLVGTIPLTDQSVVNYKFKIKYYSLTEWRDKRLEKIGI